MGKGFASPAQYRGDDVKSALISNWRALTTHLNSYVPTFNADGTTLALPGDLDVAGALTVGTLPAIDHGADVGGLGDDDHTQYSKADGTRAFSAVVSGVTPTADAHLSTKKYVDDHHDALTWSSFTPTWTMSGSSPTLGNGVLAGQYFQVGELVLASIFLKIGSTTTIGTGYHQFALPVAALTPGSGANLGLMLTQQGWVFDSSLSDWHPIHLSQPSSGSTVIGYTYSTASLGVFLFTDANPITLAVDDQVRMFFTYRTAAL